MITQLNKLLEALRKSNFDFQSQKPLFNPMEEFVYRVRDKENTHSRILEDILNPKGSHNQGSIFLEAFLREILEQICDNSIHIEDFNYEEDFFIKTEFCIKEFSFEKSDLGRIDLYIEIKDVQGKFWGIIIENKINDAIFQPDQLQRYESAIKEKFIRENKVSQIIGVCLPRLSSIKPKHSWTIILPDKLGDIFEKALEFSQDIHVSNIMTSYITCLRNINKINASMNNAGALYDFLKSNQAEVKVSDIKAVIDAYNSLPALYLEKIYNSIKQRLKNKPDDDQKNIIYKIGATTKGYLDIWDERIYRQKETWQWLSVTTDYNCVKLYLVSNEKNDQSRDEKAKSIKYGLGQRSGGVTWYKPINISSEKLDEDRFQINFDNGLPDIEYITNRIFEILDEMENGTNNVTK